MDKRVALYNLILTGISLNGALFFASLFVAFSKEKENYIYLYYGSLIIASFITIYALANPALNPLMYPVFLLNFLLLILWFWRKKSYIMILIIIYSIISVLLWCFNSLIFIAF